MSDLLPALRDLFSPSKQQQANDITKVKLTPHWHARQLLLALLWPIGVYVVVSRLQPQKPRDLLSSGGASQPDGAVVEKPTTLGQVLPTPARTDSSGIELLVAELLDLKQRLASVELQIAASQSTATVTNLDSKSGFDQQADMNLLFRRRYRGYFATDTEV